VFLIENPKIKLIKPLKEKKQVLSRLQFKAVLRWRFLIKSCPLDVSTEGRATVAGLFFRVIIREKV
jgi:hypothetical protein